MALATVTQLRSLLRDKVSAVSDNILNLYLELSAPSVVSHGVAVDHPRFAHLHMYMTANDLELGGIIERDVASESVDGISKSYFGKSRDNESHTTYFKVFLRVKFEILGFAGRSGA